MRFYDGTYNPATIRAAYENSTGIEYAPQWVIPTIGAPVIPVDEFEVAVNSRDDIISL